MIDYIGTIYYRLVPILEVSPKIRRNHPHRRFLCVCLCGNKFVALAEQLRSGHTKSCGCWRHRVNALAVLTGNKSKLFKAWGGMFERCTNVRHKQYAYYGGRGISVCDRWSSYSNFIEDMGFPTSSDHSLERVNVDLNYSPDNCVWATDKMQQRNKRSNILLTANGKTQCVGAWAEETGIGWGTLRSRMKRGLSGEDVIRNNTK